MWVAAAVLLVGVLVLSLLIAAVRDADPPPVGAAQPPAAKAAADDRRPLTVVTWNVCANTWRSCPSGGRPEVAANAVADLAKAQTADIVLMQEVCQAATARLPGVLGAGWTVRFAPAYLAVRAGGNDRLRRARCSGGLGGYGLAVAVRSALLGRVTQAVRLHPLPSPAATRRGVEQRLVMCLQMETVRLQVCNAHLSIRDQDPAGTLRAQQAEQLAHEMWLGQKLGYASLVGGDLNALPDGTAGPGGRPILAPLYDRATECEATGQQRPTYGGAKLDYLFAGPGLQRVACDVVMRPESDHRALVGRFQPGSSAGAPAEQDPPALPANAFAEDDGGRSDGALLSAALRRGVAGLEVDVYPQGGATVFVVGSGRPDPWQRRLDAHYLRPLQQWAAANGGRVRHGSTEPFTLVLDLGSGRSDAATYARLDSALAPYRSMLSRLDGGRDVPGAVRVVVPDTAALRAHYAARSSSYVFAEVRYPLRVAGTDRPLPPDAVAMLTVRLRGVPASTLDGEALRRQVGVAHEHGYRVRLSGLDEGGARTDLKRLWASSTDAGVDLIGIRDIDGLAAALSAPVPAAVTPPR